MKRILSILFLTLGLMSSEYSVKAMSFPQSLKNAGTQIKNSFIRTSQFLSNNEKKISKFLVIAILSYYYKNYLIAIPSYYYKNHPSIFFLTLGLMTWNRVKAMGLLPQSLKNAETPIKNSFIGLIMIATLSFHYQSYQNFLSMQHVVSL